MNDDVHIPEAAAQEYAANLHKKNTVQLFFGAFVVCSVLLAAALFIAHTHGMWPFASQGVSKNSEPELRATTPAPPVATVAERLAELRGAGTSTPPSNPKLIEQRRKEIGIHPTVAEPTKEQAIIQLRLKELSH